MSFGPEWFVVLGVIVLLFGAKKLPELARSLGKSTNEFKQGMKEGTEAPEQPPQVSPPASTQMQPPPPPPPAQQPPAGGSSASLN
jgi:sec-independent protein translocase protein TatA